MSESRHHSRVQSVPSTSLDVVGVGAILAAAVIGSLIQLLSIGAQKAFEQLSVSNLSNEPIQTLKPAIAIGSPIGIQNNRIIHDLSKYNLSPTESLKVSALLNVTNTSYVIENREAILHPLENLIKAQSMYSVQQARKEFFQVIESHHQKVFVKALSEACKQAAIKIGFHRVERMQGPSESIRLIATDRTGVRTLVTEISNERVPQLEYEMLGITDGSCRQILDDYEKTLKSLGVQINPSERRFTGGVPYLKTAQEFLRKNVRTQITPNHQQKTKPVSSTRRPHRLNQNRKIQIKH